MQFDNETLARLCRLARRDLTDIDRLTQFEYEVRNDLGFTYYERRYAVAFGYAPVRFEGQGWVLRCAYNFGKDQAVASLGTTGTVEFDDMAEVVFNPEFLNAPQDAKIVLTKLLLTA